jgi:imidazole glycerol phosphate synthase subunit HisF
MEAYTREQNVTIKAPVTRMVNTVVKAPVITLKLTQDEAQDLIQAIDAGANDAAAAAVGILMTQLEIPSVENTAE